MDFDTVIDNRRTIRDFQAESIPEEKIKKMIGNALKAPTNDHMRDWHYIVIRDKNIVNRLLDIIPKGISEKDMDQLIKDWNLNDPQQQECYRQAVPKQHRMLLDAAIMVIPLLKQKTNIFKPDSLSYLNGFASIWCSIENLFLSATNEGYGCTLRIPLGNEDKWAKEILQFPDDYFMPCFIGIGKPKSDRKMISQKNIQVGDRIHWEKW